MLVDGSHHAGQQLLVGRLHLHVFYLLFQLVALSVLHLHQPAHVDVIDDGTSENVHVERLHDVGICSCLQTLQLVLVPVLGSQQDDGDMIRHRIHL